MRKITENRRILLVEDNPGDAGLIEDMLDVVDGPGDGLEHVETLAGALAALRARGADAVLLDLRLPDGSGLECVQAIREVSRDVAIVVLTGLDHEALAMECIVAGAQDYIRKNDIRAESLRRSIGYSIARVREASAQRQADTFKEQLRHAQKLEALGTLSAGIAHDLNNTLLPITTMTSLLLETADTEFSRKGLGIVLQSAQRAKVLVREILQFSRKSRANASRSGSIRGRRGAHDHPGRARPRSSAARSMPSPFPPFSPARASSTRSSSIW